MNYRYVIFFAGEEFYNMSLAVKTKIKSKTKNYLSGNKCIELFI